MFPPVPPQIAAQQQPQAMSPSMMMAFGSGRQAAPPVDMQAIRGESIIQAKADLKEVGEATKRLVVSLRAVAPHLLAYIPHIINIGTAMEDELTQVEERIGSQSGRSEMPETPSPSAEIAGVAA